MVADTVDTAMADTIPVIMNTIPTIIITIIIIAIPIIIIIIPNITEQAMAGKLISISQCIM